MQAFSALALWVLGIELLPGLHVAAHALLPAHHHGDADARPWRVTESKRPDLVARGSGVQCHDHDRVSGHCHERPAEERDDGEGPLEHGDGSLAHGQLALAGPPPPPIIDRGIRIGRLDSIAAPIAAPPALVPRTIRQRGPPVTHLIA